MSGIRTAVIGFGTAGRVFHAPLVAADPAFELSAIVTASSERRQLAAEQYPQVDLLADTRELFARAADFDLVIVGSPNTTHAPLAIEAVRAGLHVVIDKPIAVTSAEAQRVADAARERGVLLSVFQNRRWDGDFLTLSEVVARGELGEIRQFESAFEWWKPEIGDRWKDTTGHDEGGGILYDLGPHLIDQAFELFGEVTDMHAELDVRRPGAVNDDDSLLTLHHENGVRSRLWMSAVAPVPRARFRVVGSKAVFTSFGLDPQEPQSIAGVRPGDPGFGLHADGRSAIVEGPTGRTSVPLRAGSYSEFYRRLARAIRGEGDVPVQTADSIRSLEIIERALRTDR